MTTLASPTPTRVPAEIDDSINAAILAVSEDTIQASSCLGLSPSAPTDWFAMSGQLLYAPAGRG